MNKAIGFAMGPVEGSVRNSIPKPQETIEDDMHIDLLVQHFDNIHVYQRQKDVCPFNRGNWVIDFINDNIPIPQFCVKLPLEMKKEEVERWLKPLRDAFKNKQN